MKTINLTHGTITVGGKIISGPLDIPEGVDYLHPLIVQAEVIPPSGTITRVKAVFTPIVEGFCHQTIEDITDLPDPQEGVRLIVSGLVFAATSRKDVFTPAIGHPDVVRGTYGEIISVPCLIGKEGAE